MKRTERLKSIYLISSFFISLSIKVVAGSSAAATDGNCSSSDASPSVSDQIQPEAEVISESATEETAQPTESSSTADCEARNEVVDEVECFAASSPAAACSSEGDFTQQDHAEDENQAKVISMSSAEGIEDIEAVCAASDVNEVS